VLSPGWPKGKDESGYHADILGMSHRTVSKHLEHIFEKLGVETRSATTAIAGQFMPRT
jgi:hypothetical protein